MTYINIMESINEIENKIKCSSCKVSRESMEFEICGPGACFKTCHNCRKRKKNARAKKSNSSSSSGFDLVISSSSPASSTIRDHWLLDGWADMTPELLEPMTFDERCAIHICMTTVVSRLNIFFITRQIHKYCGRDPSLPFDETGEVPVGTVMDEETIEVVLPDREGHFTVKLGDTWGEVRENLHCC